MNIQNYKHQHFALVWPYMTAIPEVAQHPKLTPLDINQVLWENLIFIFAQGT